MVAGVLEALGKATDDAREGGVDDRVDGVPAAYVAAPAAVEELTDVMRVAADHHLVVGVRGGASKLGWGPPPSRVDLLVDTRRLDTVLEHAAGDLVVRAQAGVRLADLQQMLAASRQWLALDPPEPGATVGGIVATGAAGPRRLRYGTPRDLLIGITVVLADGTLARAGGKVVKNVAGYDLAKLYCGSYGTLGVVAECIFRLHPLQPAVRVVRVPVAAPAEVWALVRRVLHDPVVPSAVEVADGAVDVVFESIESAADAQAATVASWYGDAEVADRLPDGFGERPWRHGDVGVKVTHAISALPHVLTAIDTVAATGLAARVTSHAATGVTWLACSADEPTAVAAALAVLRRTVEPYDGAAVVVTAPPGLESDLDVWGPVRGLALMRRVKDRFDPEHRMCPGRFVGGI